LQRPVAAPSFDSTTESGGYAAVADFPQLLPTRNSQITWPLIYRLSRTTTGQKQEGAMRVRVAADGRLLGLDTGDWSTLIAGSMLAALLAFFM
jgi:hypothetical protein